MTRTNRSLLRDAELVEMLRDQPELLALADAVVETQQGLALSRGRRAGPRRRTLVASLSGVAAAVGAIVALLLVAPWQGSPSFVEKALAAVGAQPVLHVVTSQPAPSGTLLDLKTGQPISQTLRTEVWFDRGRQLKKSIFTIDGVIVDEALETRAGGWTRSGPIYTCAWIAGHPAEATKAGVSCNANRDNGTTPRAVPEAAPALDPALSGFVDRYQAALASGEARQIGAGTVDGHDVVWLRFDADGRAEDVAVDAHTYKPVLIKEEPGAPSVRVLTAETVPYESTSFRKPPEVTAQSGGSVASETPVTPHEAAATLGGEALWLGESWNDLRLVATTREVQTIGYGPDAQAGRALVVDFTYAKVADGALDRSTKIDIYESTSCVLNVGWTCSARDPADAGVLQFRGPVSILRRDALFVAIWGWSVDQDRALDIARSLSPLGSRG